MFQADELVVYPAQGVGKIESIDHQDIGGAHCEFYIVRIMSNNITLMVPVHNALNVGLRPLISEQKAQEIYAFLCDDQEVVVYAGQNWNRRYREYTEKLKSVDLTEVADVVRELLLISRQKELSFGEKRLLEQAMLLITGELSGILGVSEQELRETIFSHYALPQAKDRVKE